MTTYATQGPALGEPAKPRYRPMNTMGAPPQVGAARPFDPRMDAEVAHKPMGAQRPGAAPRPGARPIQPGPMTPPPPPTAPPVAPPVAPVAGTEAPLTGAAFLPGDDKRLTGAQGATDSAAKTIADGDSYSARAGAGADRYRGAFGTGAVKAADLGALPDRTALAKQALADFDAQGEQALAARFRKVGQASAKFGRLGMGDVNAELGSIQGDFERDRMAKANELARSVSEGDIGDRFRRVEYETGLGERNADRSFDRARTAVDLGGRDADRDIGNEYDQFNAAGSLEDRIFGQGRQNRDEYRGERGYQDSRRQQTLEDRIRQRELENAEREAEFNRSYRQSIAGR